MSENILEVKGLTKDYGDFVLDKLTFTVPKGVIMGLIGENGAGKSTTINCILNEISKTDGNIEIFGKDYLSEEIEIKDKIGVVFDENHFPDIFTPNEIGTYMSGIYSKWERNTYVNYLSKFELPADKRVKDFSKGMKVKLLLIDWLAFSCISVCLTSKIFASEIPDNNAISAVLFHSCLAVLSASISAALGLFLPIFLVGR